MVESNQHDKRDDVAERERRERPTRPERPYRAALDADEQPSNTFRIPRL